MPTANDHMLAFIYTAYNMMALLYETVPVFEDTRIECLGDLPRYRMATEDDDLKDREIWTGIARHWYSCASDKAPTTGRFYHHLAILERPSAVQTLLLRQVAICPRPLRSNWKSILNRDLSLRAQPNRYLSMARCLTLAQVLWQRNFIGH